MVQFTPVAHLLDEAVFADLPAEQRPQGHSVRDVLARADVDDCVDVPVPMSMREQLRLLGAAMNDESIAAAAEVSVRRVPVGHLRKWAPDARVLLGIRIKYTEAESEFLKDA